MSDPQAVQSQVGVNGSEQPPVGINDGGKAASGDDGKVVDTNISNWKSYSIPSLLQKPLLFLYH